MSDMCPVCGDLIKIDGDPFFVSHMQAHGWTAARSAEFQQIASSGLTSDEIERASHLPAIPTRDDRCKSCGHNPHNHAAGGGR